MQQPFCLMDGSVCSCYMHYTGFPSALHSPCLPTFSHLHLGLATLGTLPTSCMHRRLKSIEKNCTAPFQSLQSWAKGIYFRQSHGFSSLQGPCRTQSKAYLFSQPCCGMHNIPREEFGKVGSEYHWILPPVKACGQELHLPLPWLKVVYKGNMEISALNFFLFISWLLVVNVNWI